MRKTIIACVAAVMALGGGTAVAAKLVTSSDIKDGTIQSRDLSSSVRSQVAKHAKDGVNGKDGKDGKDGATGATGAQGAQGEKGNAGAAGAAGAKGDKGDTGDAGAAGVKGDKGDAGADGASAFAIWQAADPSRSGSTAGDFLASLVGAKGADGTNGVNGTDGQDGKSYGCDGTEVTDPANAPTCPGAKGDQGDKGDPGAPGKDGVSGYEVVGRNSDLHDGHDDLLVDPNASVTLPAACANGKKAIGGGAAAVDTDTGVALDAASAKVLTLNASYPSDVAMVPGSIDSENPSGLWAATSWTVVVTNTGTDPIRVQPYVICANV